MKRANSQFGLLMLCATACLHPAVASAQNTAPRPAPGQTSSGAAAGASGSQGNGVPRGSGTRGGSAAGRNGVAPSRQGSGGRVGITGVPQYRIGLHGDRGVPAAKATDKVAVVGDADGDGRAGDSVGLGGASARLPGMPALPKPLGLTTGMPLQVRLLQPVDSGTARNGQVLSAVLAAPAGGLQAGVPVQLTVVAAAAAGRMTSRGELSLQVIGIDGHPVLSEIVTAEGKEGAKLLPDDAPARGTEAVFTQNETITLPVA